MEISYRFAALEKFDGIQDIHSAWESIRENIWTSVKFWDITG
jgi:hypothetical protein